MKKLMLISLACVLGCVSADTARIVQRQCPVKRVHGAEAYRVARERDHFDGRYVYVTDNCLYNSIGIAKWCDSKGIAHKQGVKGNHVWLIINGKDVEYIDGLGIVAR